MLYRKIDTATGLFIEDCLFDKPPMIEKPVKKKRWELVNEEPAEVEYDDVEYEPDPQYIAGPAPEGFIWPGWNGSGWVEGGTNGQIW